MEAFTTQNLFFMAPTKAGARVSRDIHVSRMRANGTWADGMNIHGQHANVLVEDCEVRYSRDDAFAAWSIGVGQTNITFTNNQAFRPSAHFIRSNKSANYTFSCFANYGGLSTTFVNNSGTGCYKDAVVIFGNMYKALFGGRGNSSSTAVVTGSKGMNTSCHFEVWPGAPDGLRCDRGSHGCFPGTVVCRR